MVLRCPFKQSDSFGCLICFLSPSRVNWKSPAFLRANLPLSFLLLLNLGKVKSVTGFGPETINCYIVIWISLLSYWGLPMSKIPPLPFSTRLLFCYLWNQAVILPLIFVGTPLPVWCGLWMGATAFGFLYGWDSVRNAEIGAHEIHLMDLNC